MGYNVNLMLEGGIVELSEDQTITVTMNRSLTFDEMAVIATMGEMLRRLKDGKLISYDFNPKSFETGQELIKCEWKRSGNLKVHGRADKPRRFVQSVEDAVKEHRSFTCYRSLVSFLPSHREPGVS